MRLANGIIIDKEKTFGVIEILGVASRDTYAE